MVHILVTNDDGVDARGIKVLAGAFASMKNVRVTVVAPEHEQSTTSHSLTLHRPLRIYKKKKGVFAVNGTPTDCVYIGASVILKDDRPDFIFSGINRGGNLGDDIHYSGTVSAALEGGIMGLPSVAFSQFGGATFNYTQGGRFAKKLLGLLLKNPLPRGLVLNVNFPANAKSLDFDITKTGKRDYGKLFLENLDPRGRPYYWIGGDQFGYIDIEGSDCNAVFSGRISVTPLAVNLTSQSYMKTMRHWKR